MSEIDLRFREIRARGQGVPVIADGIRGAAALLQQERDIVEQAGIRLVQFEQLPMQQKGLFEILLAESDGSHKSIRSRCHHVPSDLSGGVNV